MKLYLATQIFIMYFTFILSETSFCGWSVYTVLMYWLGVETKVAAFVCVSTDWAVDTEVNVSQYLSDIFQLLSGVPQGSDLGPVLFLLYMSELFVIVAEFGFTSHVYADDTQLYISTPAAVSHMNAIERFHCCITLNEFATGWPEIVWSWTRTRRRSRGSAHDSILTRISHRNWLYRTVRCCGFLQPPC